jgi:hypothetical protein
MSELLFDMTPRAVFNIDDNSIRPDGRVRTLLTHADHPVVAIIGARAVIEGEGGYREGVIESINDGLVTLRITNWPWADEEGREA